MFSALGLLSLGLLLLYYGGNWLVDGAQIIARKLGLSTLLISIVIIGFGTSVPELLVAINANLASKPDIAVGNVVGSNIANLLLVMAVTALIFPLDVNQRILRLDGGSLVGITLLYMMLAMDGAISRADACVLILSILGYLVFRASNDEHDHADGAPNITLRSAFILAIAGLIALPFGADLFLQGAIALAHKLGLSDELIGLTVVALGTSVPELATCIVAAIRRDVDIVIGNILGSNIFNLTLVMGGAALVRPLSVAKNFVELGHSVLLAATILSLILMFTGSKLCRKEGATMLALYVFIISIWVV
jgi:cation:H+ antiporter